MRTGRGYLGLLVLLGCAFAAIGCRRIKDRLDVKPIEDLIDRSGKIPDDFPRNVPVYPGAKVVGTMAIHADSGTKHGYVVWLETVDPFQQVNGYYDGALQGFEKRTDTGPGREDRVLWFVEKSSGMHAWVRIQGKVEGNPGKTAIELNVQHVPSLGSR
jgi:hypothetical protein